MSTPVIQKRLGKLQKALRQWPGPWDVKAMSDEELEAIVGGRLSDEELEAIVAAGSDGQAPAEGQKNVSLRASTRLSVTVKP